MSTLPIVCSSCAKPYLTRNGFARHALTVHKSLGVGTGTLLPLSPKALSARMGIIEARNRRRRQKNAVGLPVVEDCVMTRTIWSTPNLVSTPLNPEDEAGPSCLPPEDNVVEDPIKRQRSCLVGNNPACCGECLETAGRARRNSSPDRSRRGLSLVTALRIT